MNRLDLDNEACFVNCFEELHMYHVPRCLNKFKDLLYELEKKRELFKPKFKPNLVHPCRRVFRQPISDIIQQARVLKLKKKNLKDFYKRYVLQIYLRETDSTGPQDFYHPLNFLINPLVRNGFLGEKQNPEYQHNIPPLLSQCLATPSPAPEPDHDTEPEDDQPGAPSTTYHPPSPAESV